MKTSLCAHGLEQRIISNENPLPGSLFDDDKESLSQVFGYVPNART